MGIDLLRLRFCQLKNQLRQGSVFHAILLAAVYVVCCLLVYRKIASGEDILHIIGASLLLCLTIQLSRKDKGFVFGHLRFPVLQFFWEYLALCLPVIICLLLTGGGMWCFIYLSLPAIAGIRFSLKGGRTIPWIGAVFRHGAFEWWSGIRRNSWLWSLLYLLALGLCFLPFISLALLWIITGLNASFFNRGESLQLLFSGGRNGRKLLRNKLLHYGFLTTVLSLPVLVLYLLFHPLHWPWVIFALSALNAFTGIAVVLKYKLYQPDRPLPAHGLLVGLAGVSVLVPFLLPLMPVMWLYYYPKALKNLNYYFHDSASCD